MRRAMLIAIVALGALAAPGNALGANLWARSDGTGLTKGKGVVSFTRDGPGRYEITFNRDMSACAYIATTSSQYTGDASYGSIFTASGHNSTAGVHVETKNPGGGLQDFAFNVVAQCPTTAAGIRFAVFDDSGAFVRGSTGTSVRNRVTGQYRVKYTRSMTACTDIATIGAVDNGLVLGPGYVFANTGQPASNVYIETKNPGGGLSAYPVHTASYCSASSPSLLGAVVDQDGTFVRGHTGVSSTRTGLGTYRLTFPRNVGNCAKVASIGAVDNTLVFNPAAVDVYNGPTATTVDIRIQNLLFFGGANLDRPFHLMVVC